MRPTQSYEEYKHVDPFEVPDLDLLRTAHEELAPLTISAQYQQLALRHSASISAEISLHPKASPEERRDFGQQAHHLLNLVHTDGTHTITTHFVEPLRSHTPLYRNHSDVKHEELTMSISTGILRLLAKNGLRRPSTAKGFSFELGTSMAINCMWEYGLIAYAAFLRQDSEAINDDSGFRKSWDVTMESDGTTLPAGRYPLQVKSGNVVTKRYHPKITVLSAHNLLGVERSSFSSFLSHLAIGGARKPPMPDYQAQSQSIAERLIKSMKDVEPLDENLLLPQTAT